MSAPITTTDKVDPHSEKDQAPAIAEIPYTADTPRAVHWYRGTLFQTLVVGWSSFLAPGAYAALAATGAGGLANVDIGNASVALAYALIVPSALAATGCISKIGPRLTLAIGAAGYVFYSAALYTNSAYRNQWFLILGAIICGATSGLFWVSEGMIIMLYSEPARKGKLLALWQSLYQLATCVGGAINLALNIDIKVKGGLRPKTYIVFIGLNCLAPIISMFLSNPKQVQRKDGKPVPGFPNSGFWKECWMTSLELKDPRVLACAFLWSQALFVPSWLSTYLAKTFSVRVRGMSSLVKPILSICWFQIMGLYLDNKRVSMRTKLLVTWGFIQFVLMSCIIWLLVITVHQDKLPKRPSYDWATPGFAAAWVPVALATAAQATAYGYFYYMAGYIFPRDADGARISRIIATLRSAESGSAAIAFGINSIGLKLSKVGYINLAFTIVCLGLGAYVLHYIFEQDKKGAYDEPAESDRVVDESTTVARAAPPETL